MHAFHSTLLGSGELDAHYIIECYIIECFGFNKDPYPAESKTMRSAEKKKVMDGDLILFLLGDRW